MNHTWLIPPTIRSITLPPSQKCTEYGLLKLDYVLLFILRIRLHTKAYALSTLRRNRIMQPAYSSLCRGDVSDIVSDSDHFLNRLQLRYFHAVMPDVNSGPHLQLSTFQIASYLRDVQTILFYELFSPLYFFVTGIDRAQRRTQR